MQHDDVVRMVGQGRGGGGEVGGEGGHLGQQHARGGGRGARGRPLPPSPSQLAPVLPVPHRHLVCAVGGGRPPRGAGEGGHGGGRDGVERGERARQLPVHARPVARGQVRQGRVHEDAAVHKLHDVERGADDRGVVRRRQHAGGGHTPPLHRAQQGRLPLHRVRGGKDGAGRLFAEDGAPGAGLWSERGGG